MDTSIGGTPLSVLMEQATALKTAQLASNRTKYDTFDVWYQHSLYSREDVIQIRKNGEFSEMISFASDCKMLGNSHYERMEYTEAIHQYERALSVFKWIEPLDPDWRNKGIEDETQRECVYQCRSDPEEALVRQLNLSCLLNLSICYLKSNEFKSCISACNAILAINPENAKAYYRRAQAKLIPKSTGMIEHQEALKDLQMASALQPNNASIKKEYLDLRQTLKQQMEKDKRIFNNLFERTENSSDDGTNDDKRLSSSSGAASDAAKPPLTYAEVLTSLKDLESAAANYEREGNKPAAAETRRRITAIQALLEQAKKEQWEAQQQQEKQQGAVAVDYNAPTDKMIQEALVQGIDLRDERVRKLMVEMEKLRVQQSSNGFANGSTGGGASVDPNKLYREAMHNIHLDESKQLAEKVLDGLTREQLIDMLVCRSTFTFHANNTTTGSRSGDGSTSVDAVIKSVSNVIAAYSPDKLYAELHEMIVQDVMQVKSGTTGEGSSSSSSSSSGSNGDREQSERTSDDIVSLLQTRYFNNIAGKATIARRVKTWLRSPLIVGIVFAAIFVAFHFILRFQV